MKGRGRPANPAPVSQVFYVRPDGDDRNDGKANTRRRAFRTVERAARACRGLSPRPIVQIAPGVLWPKRKGELTVTRCRGHVADAAGARGVGGAAARGRRTSR